jgi:hypothetical protein
VRGRIHDASGPRWTRLVLPAIGALCVAASLLFWRVDGTPLGADFFMGLALFLAAPVLLARHPPSPAELIATPGRVLVRRAGLLRQTIRARELSGASTTRAGGRLTLALERSNRDAPTLLELADEADLKAVRDALGIGHHGFGQLGFFSAPRSLDRVRAVFRIAAAAASFLLGLLVILTVDAPLLVALPTFFLLYVFPIALFLMWVQGRKERYEGKVWLAPEEVHLQDGRGRWERVRYADIESACIEGEWLVLRKRGEKPACTRVTKVRHARRGMTRLEMNHVLAQIDAAARRAHGEIVPEPGIGGAAALARGPSEPARAWLERVEATAHQLSTQTSYRGAAMSEEDLWAALENHDADPTVRAASARVLRRVASAPALVRIESALGSIRDEIDEKRMRVAIEPDLEWACATLEQLDGVRR